MGTGFVKFPRWLLEEPYLSGLSGNEKSYIHLLQIGVNFQSRPENVMKTESRLLFLQ